MPGKTKLLFITWSFSRGGGAERVLSNLICALDKTGRYEISLLEVSHESIAWEKLPDSVTVLPPVLDETNNSLFYRAKRFLRRKALDTNPTRVRKAVRRGSRYDVVVGFNYLYPTFLMYDDEISISWNHGAIWDLKDKPEMRELQRVAYKHINAIVAIAERTRDSIAEIYPEYVNKLRVIPNGFKFDEIRARSLEPCDKLLGTPLIAVGRLDENKDPVRILDAFCAIHEHHPECHLYYLGNGCLNEEVAEAITHRGLDSHAHLLGFHENPYPYIKQSSCIITMSHSEGFQTNIVEGLALGTPFISTPVGSAEELSGNGRFGMIIKSPEDAASAYDTLVSLSENSSWQEDMQQFVGRYTLERQVESFESLVAELMGGANEQNHSF